MRATVLGIGLVTAGALLTGCGGSSKPAAAGPATAASAAAVASAIQSAVSSAAAAASVPAGNGNSSFCTEARNEQAEQARDLTEFTTDSPAQLKTIVDQALSEVPKYEADAPAEIKSDVFTVAEADKKLLTSLAAANYTYTKLDPTVLSSLASPTVSAATARVAAYLTKTCGITAATSVP